MPKVGDKHFSYTPEGVKKADAYSEATGKEVQHKKYDCGDKIEGKLNGPSHKDGGIKFNLKGQTQEAEGGEFVIKKDSVEKIEQKHGKKFLENLNSFADIPVTNAKERSQKTYDDGGKTKYHDDGDFSEKGKRYTWSETSISDEDNEPGAYIDSSNPDYYSTKKSKAKKKLDETQADLDKITRGARNLEEKVARNKARRKYRKSKRQERQFKRRGSTIESRMQERKFKRQERKADRQANRDERQDKRDKRKSDRKSKRQSRKRTREQKRLERRNTRGVLETLFKG